MLSISSFSDPQSSVAVTECGNKLIMFTLESLSLGYDESQGYVAPVAAGAEQGRSSFGIGRLLLVLCVLLRPFAGLLSRFTL